MFRKVLFPTDFSQGASRAIEKFEKQNEINIGELVVLHVVDEGIVEELMNGYSLLYENTEREIQTIREKLQEKAMKRLQKEVETLRRAFKTENIKPLVRFGFPWEEIVKTAEEEDVSLILLPSHGKLGFSHEIMGSTTVRVLRKTRRPVLIIKTHHEEGDEEK